MLNTSFNKPVSQVEWQLMDVVSPLLDHPVTVVVARDIPYIANANHLQNLSIYLPKTSENLKLIGRPARTLPGAGAKSVLPKYHVHIHGGAWRAHQLTSSSIEATVAQAFFDSENSASLMAIASLNYTVSPFPTHPDFPYDPIKDNHSNLSREAIHPQHISDILHGLELLRSFGVNDQSYILSGHSSGACIAFQSVLQSPASYGLGYLADPPAPAALLGLNGLYDLPGLVNGLDASHQHLREDYIMMLNNAFGPTEQNRFTASPSRIDPAEITKRISAGKVPELIVVDHSKEDQLSPVNQQELIMENLRKVKGIRLVKGARCTGAHAVPWEQGMMIWQNILDILQLLQS